MDDSTLSAYNPQLLGLFTPEWRLRKSIYVEQKRPAGVIMCEALWIKALYKTNIIHYYYAIPMGDEPMTERGFKQTQSETVEIQYVLFPIS